MAKLYGHAIIIKKLNADHTYVTSSDGGVWPCWGRSKGGKVICAGNGSSNKANCLSQSKSHAGIIYGVTGVCHQTANRILYPAGALVNHAKGYWASSLVYGTYGTHNAASFLEWQLRKKRCSKVKGGLGLEKRAIPFNSVDPDVKVPAQEPGFAEYLEKVNALYTKELDEKHLNELVDLDKMDILGSELELMADYRLGNAQNNQDIKKVRDLQAKFTAKKEDLDAHLIGKNISAVHYAEQVNASILKLLKESGQVLGEENYVKLFGMPSDTIFQLVDASILAQYHQE